MPDITRNVGDGSARANPAAATAADESVNALFEEILKKAVPQINIPELNEPFAKKASEFDAVFSKIDGNRDGSISLSELNQAVRSKQLTAHEIHNVMGMRRCLEQVAALNPEGDKAQIRKSDLAELVAQVRGYVVFNKFSRTALEFYDAATPVRDGAGNKIPLYKDQANPLNSIQPEACRQFEPGGGNCILISSMSSLARGNKDSILKMITDNGNDTYTVVFPGVPDKPVTVTAPSSAEVDQWIAERYGTWGYVLQKAFGRLMMPEAKEDLAGGREAVPYEYALRALHKGGTAYTNELRWSSYSTQSRLLLDALNKGVPVTAGTPGDGNTPTKNYNLPSNHAYAVLDFKPDASNPENGLITLRNPWAHLIDTRVNDLGDGKFQLSLKDFNRDFQNFSFGERAPLRRTIYYNWAGNTNQAMSIAEPTVLFSSTALIGMAAHSFPKTGAFALTPLAAYEFGRDAHCLYKADNSADRLKYGLATGADAVMLAGVASRFFPATKAYGLYAAYGGFVSRWAIERWL